MEKTDSQNEAWVNARLDALTPAGDWRPDAAAGLARLRNAKATPRLPFQRWMWVAAAAGVGLLAFPAPRAATRRFCVACLTAAQDIAAPKAPLSRVKPPAQRQRASDFTLIDSTGKQTSVAGMRGNVVLLNFWATWCGGCKVEIPWLMEFQKTYGSQGLQVLGISMDEDGWKLVRPFLEQKRLTYPVVIGDDVVAKLYGVSALPVSVLIDRAGRVALTQTGLAAKDEYEREIRALLLEK